MPGVQPARNPTEWQRLSTVCWMINSTQDGALRAQLVHDNAALLHRFTQSLLQGAPAGATLVSSRWGQCWARGDACSCISCVLVSVCGR